MATPRPKDEAEVTMDIYEPVQMRRALVRLGVRVSVSTLGMGDYQLSDSVCIERKTVSDFLNSMYSGRLGYQLQLLANSFNMPFLLIEGRPEYHARAINLKSFYAYLSKLVISSPIGLLQTPNLTSSAMLIALMLEKMGESPSKPRIRPPKARDEQEGMLQVLCSFPGIGPILSQRLLRKFKSLRSVFEAPEKAIAEVKGIGSGRAKDLVRLLDHPFEF